MFSASPPNSDIARRIRHVSTGLMQRSKLRLLFDHIVGAGEQRRRDFNDNGEWSCRFDRGRGRRRHIEIHQIVPFADGGEDFSKPSTPKQEC
jgi:hypothetical protein